MRKLNKSMPRWYLNPVVVVSLILFFIPFFWFEWGEGDYGGDSSRLYFLDPDAWLRYYGFSEINIADFGNHNPNYFLLPFLFLLKGLRAIVFQQTHLALAAFNGFILATAWLAMYGIIRDLHLKHERDELTRLAAIVGALFFILIPVMTYNWQKALYTWQVIAVYPLLIWFWLRYVQQKNTLYLLLGLLLTLVFSVNFSPYIAAPNLFAFFPLALPIIVIVAALQRKIMWLLRGAIIFLGFFVLLHGFHLVPQTASLFSPHNNFYQAIFTEAGQIGRGRNYFEAIRPMIKLVYNVAGLPQYSLYTQTGVSRYLLNLITQYNVRAITAFLAFPLIIILGVLFSRHDAPPSRVIFLSSVLLFLLGLFLMTANLFGEFGPRGYAALFSLPGFAMFRSFTGVFMVPYIFLYAISFALALRYVLAAIARPLRRSLVACGLVGVLLYGSLPLLSGRVVNGVMPDTRNLTLANRFPADFIAMVGEIKKIELDGKIVTTPLTNYDYQVIDDASGGAYVGPSPVGILAGKHTFSGLSTFAKPAGIFSSAFLMDQVRDSNYRAINRLLALMNVGFVFENASPIAYRAGFTGFPYGQDVWQLWPETESFRHFTRQLGYRPIVQRGLYTLYANPDTFLPHLYIPRHAVSYQSPEELADYLTQSKEYDIRTAFFYRDQLPVGEAINPAVDDTLLEFKKINEMKYRIRIHNLRETVPLVFSHAWHSGWKLFVAPPASSPDNDKLQSGPHFMSPIFQGTLQNQNLSSGRWWESWSLPAIAATHHQPVNDYANSWQLDLNYLKNSFGQALRARPDGGYDLELILEFAPRRIFFGASAVSLMTLTVIMIWLRRILLEVWRR